MTVATLVLDSGSPTLSVALAGHGGGVVERRSQNGRASADLVALIDEILTEVGLAPGAIGALAALSGPGSFTGLRVGLATVLGLSRALGIPATALSTHRALALWWRRRRGDEDPAAHLVVDGYRGHWFVATGGRSDTGEASEEEVQGIDGEVQRMTPRELGLRRPAAVVGFGADRLAAQLPWSESRGHVPAALAGCVARELAERPPAVWDWTTLCAPRYLMPPAARRAGS